MSITVSTWNAEWKTPASATGPRIASILGATESDIIVLTEGVRGLLPDDGNTVAAGGDWGYGQQPSRRKVIIWSRFPLTLGFLGAAGAACGRVVVATAALPDGPVRIIGVCIPGRTPTCAADATTPTVVDAGLPRPFGEVAGRA